MPSQFFGLNISYTGLLAANAGVNTTANNISNAETNGYSRQQAIQEASKAIRTFTTYGSAGAGVDTIAIERIRDEFYDTKFWDNSEKLGEQEVKVYYMKTIENYFQETDTISGFNTAFNLMYNALEELQKNSGDTATKSQFVMYAQSLCDYFNTVSTQLSELQKDVNTEIKDSVSQINSIASQIATLNKQINVIEINGAHANELRDKRALLIDDLSRYVQVEVTETPIMDTANNYNTGANRYMVRIAGNQLLVDTNEYRELECISRENNETINQSDAQGLYNMKWNDGTEFNMYSSVIGGKLQGLIEMRDGNNTENFRGTVTSVDPTAYTAQVKVSLDYLKDLDKCTLSETGGLIRLGAEVYHYSSWSYSLDTTTNECTYTFQLDPNYDDVILSTTRVGKEVNVGYQIDYQGIPYYQEQLNEFVRLFARSFNNILTEANEKTGLPAVDGYGDPATFLLTGTAVSGKDQYDFGDYYNAIKQTVIELENAQDSYYRITASNFAIAKNISDDPDRLATRTGASEGDSKSDIVDKLIALKTDKSMFSFRGGSASEFLQSVLSDVALNAARANSSLGYYTTMNKTIDNQRISVSGVDSDEEAINLVKYQNAYNLASKMIQTFTEIYDRLILETGV